MDSLGIIRKSWVAHDWHDESYFTFFDKGQAWLFAAERAWAGRQHYGEPYPVNLKLCLEGMELAIKNAREAFSENRDEEGVLHVKAFFKVYDKVSDHSFIVSEADHHA
jgi:hypothetical protein